MDSKSELLELKDALFLKTDEGAELEFEVVGIMEDAESAESYAVLLHEANESEQTFIVADLHGNLLEDETLAQQVLDDYLIFSEEAGEERGS